MDWLGRYRDWTRNYEAPGLYHKWSAVTVFGHALGRRVFMELDGTLIYPGHMMTMLVGPPGILRKSHSAGMAVGLIEMAQSRCRDPKRLHLMPHRMSNESIYDNLVPFEGDPERDDCMGFLFASEFSSVANKNSYMEEIPEILCNLYDCSPGEYDKKTRTVKPAMFHKRMRNHSLSLRNPGITMLACCTPTHLQTTLPPYIRSTGFLSRVLIVHAESSERPPNALVNPDPDHWEVKDDLARGLALATEMEGVVVMTRETRNLYLDWYEKQKHWLRRLDVDSIQHGFVSRMHLHTLRLAVIFSGVNQLGVKVKDRQIPMLPYHFERAAVWCHAIAQTLPLACGELAYSVAQRCEERVLNAIMRYGGGPSTKKHVKYRNIFTYVCKSKRDHFKGADIKEALERLVELKRIERHDAESGSITQAEFRIPKSKPGPWSGSPAQGEPSPEYMRQQLALLEDEQIKKEIAAGMRDKWGNLLH
jgi:hypothetical protein